MKLGRYEILGELGRGGMATVFRAHDPEVGREVAIKVLPRQFSHDPQFLTRFRREARTVGSLDHPHIIPIYDVGEDDGQPYIVMRLLSGGTLADRLKSGPLPLADALQLLEQIADALDDAHARNIIHRDLKPSNVLLDRRGAAYLSDFGIAKALDATAQLTGSGIIGTPRYMSPEQFTTGQADQRSDQYSLAIVVFEALAGKPPFEGDTTHLMYQHLHAPPPSLVALNPTLPPQVEAVLQNALAKTPGERFGSVREFAAALRAAAEGRAEAPALRPASPTVVLPAETRTIIESVPLPAPPAPVLEKIPAPQPAGAITSPRGVTQAGRPRRGLVVGIGLGIVVLGLIGVAVVAVAAVALVGSRGAASATAPTLPTRPTRLAFVSNRDGERDIYLVNADGSGLINLTGQGRNDANDFQPAFSPNGGKIAFVSDRDGNNDIYLMNSDGTEVVNMTNNPANDGSPAWSADGGEIAFVSDRDGNQEIYVSSQAGVTRYTNDPATDAAPSWSARGNRLAFASDRDGNYEIYVFGPDGLARYTDNPAKDFNPRWSPQQDILAFESNRDGNYEIYLFGPDGLVRYTDNPANDFSPAWSATGGRLAFVSDRDGNDNIYIIGPEGLTRVTDDPAQDSEPAWQP